jgi:hypothetical protein
LPFQLRYRNIFAYIYPGGGVNVADIVDRRTRRDPFFPRAAFKKAMGIFKELKLQMRIAEMKFVLYAADQKFFRDEYFHGG